MFLWRILKRNWDLALAVCALVSLIFFTVLFFNFNEYRLFSKNDLKVHTLQELIHYRLNTDAFHYSLLKTLIEPNTSAQTIQNEFDNYLLHIKGLKKIYLLNKNHRTVSPILPDELTFAPPIDEQQRILATAEQTHELTVSNQFEDGDASYFALAYPFINGTSEQSDGFVIAIYNTQEFITKNFPSRLFGMKFTINDHFEKDINTTTNTYNDYSIRKDFTVRDTPFFGTAIFDTPFSMPLFVQYNLIIISILTILTFYAFWRFTKNRTQYISDIRTLKTTLDAIPTMTCFIDPLRNIQINNKAYTDTFGGKSVHTPFKSALKNIGFDTQKVLQGEALSFEQQRVTRDGQVISVQSNIFPYKDDNGDITGAVMMAHDITHYKKVEEALTEEKEYASYVVAMSPDMIMSLSTDGYPVSINPATCDATGYSIQEIMGHNFWSLLFPGKLKKEGEKLKEQMNIGQARNFHTQIMAKSGQEKTISWNSINRYDTNDNILEIILVGNDITTLEEKELKERERQKMEALGQLAGGVAHELNNLLQPIILYSEIELDNNNKESSPHSKTRNNLKRIIEHAERSSEIVQDILTFARKKTSKPHLIDIAKTGQEVLKFAEGLLPSSTKIKAAGFNTTAAFAYIRETDLLQVLTNLTNNASHAMNKKGIIHINFEITALNKEKALQLGLKPKKYAILSVSDTGAGIEEEKLAHIFEPFFTTKAIGEGTGLGLSIVYGIVKDWSGVINVESDVGVGTTFKIYIPLSKPV